MGPRHHAATDTCQTKLSHLLLPLTSLLLYLKQELPANKFAKKERDWKQKEESNPEPFMQHGSLSHGLFVSETVSILGSVEVHRCPAISKIFNLQSYGQENKEDPNIPAFRSVHT